MLAVGEFVLHPLDETTRRISAAFLGGMGDTRQEACGALSGGLIVIGALVGRASLEEDEHICTRLAARYHEQFTATFNLTRCADLRANGYGSSGSTPDGRVLFDTGQSGDVLLHNAALFELDLGQIDAFAISHAHYDHTGGLPKVLERTRPGIPLYASPDLFRERFARRGELYESIGLRMTRDELEQHVELCLHAEPVEILPGVWTTGEITDRSAFEGRGDNLLVRDGDGWRPDPYRDDLSLVLETSAGLVVLLGCSTF